jgi:effector-binding domain-containing protein
MAIETAKPKPSLKKIIGYILLGVLAILIILAIILPRNITINTSKEIAAPSTYVYNLINNQKNMPYWNAWATESKDMVVTYDNISIGKGSGYAWTSESMGNGKISYTDAVVSKSISADLMMEGMDTSRYTINLTEAKDKTKIDWEYHTHLSFPKNIMGPIMGYFIKKYNGKSIANIEAEVLKRKQGIYCGLQLNEVAQNARYFVTSRNKVSFDKISQYYQQNIAAIYQKLQTDGISASGPPCSLFYTYEERAQTTDMAVAVPILSPKAVKDLTSENLQQSNAIVVDFYGNNNDNKLAHNAASDYIKDRKYLYASPIVEEYVTDPLKEKDQSKWLTKIYYYVAEKTSNSKK